MSLDPPFVPGETVEDIRSMRDALYDLGSPGPPNLNPVRNGDHYGRSWSGHAIEDACKCIKEPCGLVGEGADPDCDQHGIRHARTMRQGHLAAECPGEEPTSDKHAHIVTAEVATERGSGEEPEPCCHPLTMPLAETIYAWTPTRELRIESGPVVIDQTRSDPGDMGEPRIVQSEGVTYVVVPDFDYWPTSQSTKYVVTAESLASALAEALGPTPPGWRVDASSAPERALAVWQAWADRIIAALDGRT